MPVTINTFELENVKRIKAVALEPSPTGLTIIGGRNEQGKTSVLDALSWALGGEKYRPSKAQREGSVIPPSLKVTLSNGIVVERKGKNSALKVTDPNGNKSGQQLLNSFIETLALDLPQFMNATPKEKANILLRIIGVGDKLYELEHREQELYNKRHTIGQIADQKTKFAAEMEHFEGVPEIPVSASQLIAQQQEILARNGENQRMRQHKEQCDRELEQARQALDEAKRRFAQAQANAATAAKSAEDLVDESTAELEQNIAGIETLNAKIRANLDKAKAEEKAKEYSDQYAALTAEIEETCKAKYELLHGADLPLEGLSVEDGELTFNDQKWDNMSGSQQLRVATAIVRRLNPECGFVLLDKLEQMDTQTLADFGAWLEAEGLQAIATRVSDGDECSIIIEDGYSVTQKSESPAEPKTWKAGEF
ncbi:MAG: AAA family ATPase [Ruminococcus sp.]|nr:AAA family ATPase [Ruminococcus sp.]